MTNEAMKFETACNALHLEVSPAVAEDVRRLGRAAIDANERKNVLDGKFRGTIYRHVGNAVVSDDQWVIFLAKDNAFPATLRYYRLECVNIGAEQEQLDAVDRLIARVDAWRAANPTALKIPDAEPGECH